MMIQTSLKIQIKYLGKKTKKKIIFSLIFWQKTNDIVYIIHYLDFISNN